MMVNSIYFETSNLNGTVVGIDNNPMVGYTMACAVDIAQALNK